MLIVTIDVCLQRSNKWLLRFAYKAKLGLLFSNDLKTLHVICISWEDDPYGHSGQKDIPISEIKAQKPRPDSNPGPVAPQAKSLTTLPPPLPSISAVNIITCNKIVLYIIRVY